MAAGGRKNEYMPDPIHSIIGHHHGCRRRPEAIQIRRTSVRGWWSLLGAAKKPRRNDGRPSSHHGRNARHTHTHTTHGSNIPRSLLFTSIIIYNNNAIQIISCMLCRLYSYQVPWYLVPFCPLILVYTPHR